MLYLIILGDTHRICSSPLNEGSAVRRGLYLHHMYHSQEANIHACGGIQTRYPSKETYDLNRAATGIITWFNRINRNIFCIYDV